jgi:phosphate transport system substrate-binding protein
VLIGCAAPKEEKPLTLLADASVLPILQVAADALGKQDAGLLIQLREATNSSAVSSFCSGAVDVALSAGPLSASDDEACRRTGTEFLEIPVASDSAFVAVNVKNDWADRLTEPELKALWTGDRQQVLWSDLRKGWPREPISTYVQPNSDAAQSAIAALLGSSSLTTKPGPINEHAQDPLQGLSAAKHAVGVFTASFASQHTEKLKELPVPDLATRPYAIHLYIRKDRLSEVPQLQFLADYATGEGQEVFEKLGYKRAAIASESETR